MCLMCAVPHVHSAEGDQKVPNSPGPVAVDNWEHQEPNSGSLWEQGVPLVYEPSLQAQVLLLQ